MLAAGLPLDRALKTLEGNATLLDLSRVRRLVKRVRSLPQALRKASHLDYFDFQFLNAANESGRLISVQHRAQAYLSDAD